MIPRTTRIFWSLALGLTTVVATTRDVHAAAITPVAPAVALGFDTSTTGLLNSQVPNLVTFQPSNGTYDSSNPGGNNDMIPFGSFSVSASALKSVTTPTTISDPFSVTVNDHTAGTTPTPSATLSGLITGTVGAGGSNAQLFATINSVSTTGAFPLALGVPVGIPVNLYIPTGTTNATTVLNISAHPGVTSPTPAPEPASIAMFAALVGGLGVWHRRRAGR